MSSIVCHVNELDTLPGAIYIGRRANRFKLEESPFHNPYKVTELGRETVIRRYIDYLIRQPELLQRLPELRGRPLACWCRRSDQTEPPCHGDVLVRMLRDLPDDLLVRLERPVTTWPPADCQTPQTDNFFYTALTGTGMFAVDIGGIGNQIYHELYPQMEAVHG